MRLKMSFCKKRWDERWVFVKKDEMKDKFWKKRWDEKMSRIQERWDERWVELKKDELKDEMNSKKMRWKREFFLYIEFESTKGIIYPSKLVLP